MKAFWKRDFTHHYDLSEK